ncbi:MnmC family methyltransferase [Hydrogenobaculum acidophilum]
MEKSLKEKVLTTLKNDRRFKRLPDKFQDILIKEVSNIYKPVKVDNIDYPNIYDDYYQEFYHSITTGPLEEAYNKFVNPSLELLKEKSVVNVLDIGAGMFVNSSVLTEELLKENKRVNIVSVDKKIPPFIELNHPSDEIRYSFYKSNFSLEDKQINWKLFIMDARKIRFENYFDVILHDGFSPYKNPSLWSLDFLNNLFKSLKRGGIWISYTSNKSVECSLRFLGFKIDFIKGVGRKRPSIRAVKGTEFFNMFATKDPYFIPIRDKGLNHSEEAIISDYFLRVYFLKTKYHSPSKD